MNKLSYLLLGIAGLGLVSCSQEEVVNNTAGVEGNVQVTVSLPGDLSTRAFSQGYVAENLHYAVYNANSNTMVIVDETVFGNSLTTTVGFNLAKGQTYNIVFFAQSPASENTADAGEPSNGVYEFDYDTATLTVNYNNMNSDNNLADDYDCFYTVISTGEVGVNTTQLTAILKRPVAQVNWGTNDLVDGDGNDASVAAHDEAYGKNGQYIMTYLTTKPYTTMNMLTGAVSGNNNEVNFPAMKNPQSAGEVFPVTYTTQQTDPTTGESTDVEIPYTYVAMMYLLAPQDQSILDLNLSINNELNTAVSTITTAVPVASAPVQANYRTNIYGNLLSENVVVEVTKDPSWGGADYNYEVGVKEPETNTQGAYLITSVPELRWIAEQVNNGENNFAGETVLLENDLTLAGEWTPIGIAGNPFRGFFNGQEHTINNLVINATGQNYVGLFGYTDYANQNSGQMSSISNLTINNAQVSGRLGVAAVCGHPYATNFDNINITGLVQINGSFYVGTVGGGNNIYGNFTNITVDVEEDSYVQANSVENGGYYATYVGGVMGHPAEGSFTHSNIKSNIDVIGNVCYVGGIAGLAHYGVTYSEVECTGNVTLQESGNPDAGDAYFIGGIVGTWVNYNERTNTVGTVIFNECSFTGELSSPAVPDSYDLSTLNNITGVAFSSVQQGTLWIDGDAVQDQHWQPAN